MTPEEIIAREEARLGRRLNPDEKRSIREGATSVSTPTPEPYRFDPPTEIRDELTPARRAALAAVESRREADEARRRAADPDIITSALGAIDRGLGITAPDALVSAGDTTRDAITGVVGGATMGFGDELAGAVANPYGALLATGRLLGAPTDTMNEGARAELADYDATRDRIRTEDEAAAERSPWAYGAGTIGGGIITAPLTPGLAGSNAATMAARTARSAGRLTPALSTAARAERFGRVGRAALTGAGYGSVAGAGASSEDDIAGVLGDAAMGAGGGALGGTVLSGAGEGLIGLSHAGPAARREAARRMLDVVTGGNATATDRLVRDLGGGDVLEAAAELGRRGYTGLLDTPASIAERAGAGRSAGPYEAEMAGRPVDPERIAEVIDSVRARYPNPSERAALDPLWAVGRDMRARGGLTGGDDFTVLGDRASPAPDELIRPSDTPRLSTVGDPPPPPPASREGATLPPPGPARRRFGMADTVVGEGLEPSVRDTIPSELRMPARNPDGSTVRIPNPALEVAGPIRPSTSLAAPPEVPPPAAPVTRPRGERPLGAREMVGSWGASGPPRPRTIPYGASPGPGDVRSGRTPDTAMHILDVLDDLSGWRSDEVPELARAARMARRGVRRRLDEEMGKALGPDALAAHRAGRADAEVDIPVHREAHRAEVRTPSVGLPEVVAGLSPVGHWARSGMNPADLPGAVAAGLGSAALLYGGRAVARGRGPAIRSAGARAAAAIADSPATAAAADAVPRLDAGASGVVGRLAGAAAAEEPSDIRSRLAGRRRRDEGPDAFTTGPASTGTGSIRDRIRARRRSP